MHVRVCNQSNKSSEIEIWFNIKQALKCLSGIIQILQRNHLHSSTFHIDLNELFPYNQISIRYHYIDLKTAE